MDDRRALQRRCAGRPVCARRHIGRGSKEQTTLSSGGTGGNWGMVAPGLHEASSRPRQSEPSSNSFRGSTGFTQKPPKQAENKNNMKAIVYREYGAPDVLQLAEVDDPKPKDDEILIRVRAAEITKADCELRSFRFAVKWFWLPLRLAWGVFRPRKPVLGGYFAGEVEEVGSAVTQFKPGDAVYGSTGRGTGAYSELLCVPASNTIGPKPTNMTFEEAAAVPLGGLNALHFMRMADIQAGDAVLVNGAGGSIGIFAVQIAKTMGALVTAVDGLHKEEMLRRLGADHFIDYATEDFAAGDRAYDVVFNMVAGRSFSSCMAALKPGGRYLTANPKMSDMLRSVLPVNRSGKKAYFAFAGESKGELSDLTEMIEQGKITAAVDQTIPMDEVSEGHRRVESEERVGSIVLAVA
ncbi:MAG: NADPH:quinone reductase-like Zn-dependent oxidoreductase [Rhodothermales bacterium]|jgi:NADPH:quinone reductase-like Zn-dependent oxidoreductase